MIKYIRNFKKWRTLFFAALFLNLSMNSQTKQNFLKKGYDFLQKKQYDSAYHYLNLSKSYYLKKDSLGKLAKSYLLLSSLYGFKQVKDSSQYYLLECQNLAKELKSKQLKANIYISIAFQKYGLNDLVGALEYAELAKEIHLKEKDSFSISMVYNNIAVLHRKTGNWDKALSYNKKALELNKLMKDTVGISMSLNNIGLVYFDMNEYKKAKTNFQKAISYNEKHQIENPNPYESLADFYQWNKDYQKSTDYYHKVLEINTKNNNMTGNTIHLYKQLLTNAIHLKKTEKAIEYQQKIGQLESDLLEKTNQEKIKQLENQQILFFKEKELEHTKSVSEKNKIIFLIVVGFLILTLLFFLQSFRTSKLKRKQDRLLLERKVLRAQMNPHFIFNALSAIQSSLLDNNPLQSATYLSRFSKLIRQNFEFVNKDQIALSNDIDALKNYLETQQMRFNHNFDYTIEIDPNLDDTMTKIPPMLLQPFVENSIEHGFKNKKEQGKVDISIKKRNKGIGVIIKDNGVGFDIKKLSKEGHSFLVFKQRLRLLSKASEKSFSIHSSNKGTRVQFNLDI